MEVFQGQVTIGLGYCRDKVRVLQGYGLVTLGVWLGYCRGITLGVRLGYCRGKVRLLQGVRLGYCRGLWLSCCREGDGGGLCDYRGVINHGGFIQQQKVTVSLTTSLNVSRSEILSQTQSVLWKPADSQTYEKQGGSRVRLLYGDSTVRLLQRGLARLLYGVYGQVIVGQNLFELLSKKHTRETARMCSFCHLHSRKMTFFEEKAENAQKVKESCFKRTFLTMHLRKSLKYLSESLNRCRV